MLEEQKQPTQTELDDLISRVYDVALDPTRYEDLLDEWERTLAPFRGLSHGAFLLDEPRIAEHFTRADTVLDRVGAETKQDEIETILAQFDSVAAIIICPALRIEGINASAKRLLGAEQDAPISNLQLDEQDRPILTRQVARMIGDVDLGNSVLRIRSKVEGRCLIFHMRRAVLWDGSPVVIAVTSALRWPKGFDEILMKAFELSVAETDVVRLLIECCSVKDIAQTRGRSIETVRAQIKAILAKTETRSQIELVRVTLSMMDIANITQDVGQGPSLMSTGMDKLKELPYHTITDERGRSIDYLILGDPKGTPLLYFHMKYGFVRWTASAEMEAERLGVRVIVPVRPGFGKTAPTPKGATYAETTALDALCVLKAEKVKSCPVIALSSDHLFALMMEQLVPGTIKAIIAVAAVYPYTRPEQLERMHKFHRFIQTGARYTPHLLPFIVKAGSHLARRGGKKAFIKSVFAQSNADLETFDIPEVYEAMIMGSEVCLSEQHSSHAAFTEQTLYEHLGDNVELLKWSEGRLPYYSFNGMQDPWVHADSIAEHAQDYPWIEFKLYEDAGQLLFFKHWRDALSLAMRYI